MNTLPYPSEDRRPFSDLVGANVRAIWSFLRSEPASFWLVNIYLFFEYVRPQSIWTSIDVLPWAETALILAVAAVLVEGKLPRVRTAVGGLLLVYSVIVLLSSFTAIYPSASVAGWKLYFSWVLIFFVITATVTTEKHLFIFMLAFLLYSFKMSQHGFRTWLSNGFGFSSWGATGAPGWFQNSGEFGIQMCIFLPLSVEFILALRSRWGRWKRLFFYAMPITAVASMVASSSRGALIGGAAVGLWWILRSKHRVRALLITAVLAAATWLIVPQQQKDRFSTAGEDQTSVNRLDRWKAGIKMAHQHPALGIGYHNWGNYYGPLPHNIFIQAWSELGYSGLLAFLALIVATFVVNARTRRLLKRIPRDTVFLRHMAHGLDGALIGFMVSGFFVTVLYYPFFWINLAMTVSVHVAARNTAREAQAAAARKPVSTRLPSPVRA